MSKRQSNPIAYRIFRCGESNFYNDEILNAAQSHTSKRLQSIASAGFNGIWLRVKLRELAPGPLFEPFVKDVPQRLASLKTVYKKAGDAGLGIWLFCTEPLGLPISHPFWKKYPHLAGQKVHIPVIDEEAQYAMCSSQPEVQDYLKDGFGRIFSEIPLAGVILITVSEQVNNCYAHVPTNAQHYADDRKQNKSPKSREQKRICQCERCKVRKPAVVISEIINNIHATVDNARPAAKVVAWDWSWNFHCRPPYSGITNRLNDGVIVMADFERGGSVIRLGKKRNVEEYSLVYPGPSPRFKRHVEKTIQKHPLFAKLQVNTTYELATVPNLPLVVSLYRKFNYLRQNGCSGIMACWNFACETETLNVSAVNDLCLRKTIPSERIWLESLAKHYFGPKVYADAVVKTWYSFHRAAGSYPLNGHSFLYYSPINYALAYPLKPHFEGKPMGPSWLTHDWCDNLDNTLGSYSFTEIITLLKSLKTRWLATVSSYEKALSGCDTSISQKEISSAKVAGGSFRSCWNIYRWYLLRKDNPSSKFTHEEVAIMKDELENVETALSYVQQDSRLGFHQEAQCYMFDENSIKKKIKGLKENLNASGNIISAQNVKGN